MKKLIFSKHFLCAIALLTGANLWMPVHDTLVAKPKVFYAPQKKVRVISCSSNGEIVAYGNECDTGSNNCVVNGCPS